MKTITTSYSSPDLDGYGCAVAYAELLNRLGGDAGAHIWGVPHIEVQWLIETFDLARADGPIDDSEASVVLLDASKPDDLPGKFETSQVIEIIDHRKIHEAEKFINAESQIELVGAAATLVAERFKKADLEPSRVSALYLYGGIISNTQNFTAIATDRDREMAEWLRELSEAPDDLAERMFEAKSDLSGDRLREVLFGDLKTLNINEVPVTIAQLEIVGVQKLLDERGDEVEQLLKEVQERERAEYTFLNMKDLELGVSTILCLNQKTVELLRDLPGAQWDGVVGISSARTVRKQLLSWLQDKL